MSPSQPALSLSNGTSPQVAHIVNTAKRLREVRKASRQFLLLWSFERGLRHRSEFEPAPDTALADPSNHDWTLLYQGSVLDD